MTGITQNYARKSGLAVDSLQLKFEIQDRLLLDDSDTNYAKLFDGETNEMVMIYGLYMDGAQWNFEQKLITDSNKRFDVAPNFVCKTVKVTIFESDSTCAKCAKTKNFFSTVKDY